MLECLRFLFLSSPVTPVPVDRNSTVQIGMFFATGWLAVQDGPTGNCAWKTANNTRLPQSIYSSYSTVATWEDPDPSKHSPEQHPVLTLTDRKVMNASWYKDLSQYAKLLSSISPLHTSGQHCCNISGHRSIQPHVLPFQLLGSVRKMNNIFCTCRCSGLCGHTGDWGAILTEGYWIQLQTYTSSV